MRSLFSLTLAGAFLLLPIPAGAEEEAGVIADGRKVSLEYTLSLDDGTEVGSNVGGEALVYEQGTNKILPALETALVGMKEGESKKVTLTPADGYGEVDSELFQEVESNLVPEDSRVAGAQLLSEDPSGARQVIRVHEVKGEMVVLDLNHPLAGQTLHFDVKVLDVE